MTRLTVHTLLFTAFLLAACAAPTPTTVLPRPSEETTASPVTDAPPITLEPPANAFRFVVDRNAELGNASIIADFIAVQGSPWDRNNAFEAQAWRDLRLRTDAPQLLNDEYYWPEGGLQVIRSAEAPSTCAGGARGPLGPNNDLWLCMDDFESFRQNWAAALGEDLHPTLGLGVMPRTLSYNPESPNWMLMSPANPDEWSAVMREAGAYLAEVGWNEPLIFFFGEYENFFYGKDRPLYDSAAETAQARAEDYAELYILTQNALQEHLPQVKLAGAVTSTYSRDHTRDLQQNPYALGLEDWLEALKRLDPNFVPSAVGWQGYYWYGLDGYGSNRLLEGAEHIRGVLRDLGYPEHIPQYLDGWNGTFGNPEAEDGSMPGEARVLKEAAHLAAMMIDMLEVGAERRIQSAYYYTWNLDGPAFPDYRCGFPYQSLVSTVHEGINLNDPNYPDCNIPPSEVECLRATYHALHFISDLRDGNFVSAAFAGEGDVDVSGVRYIVTKQADTTQIVLVQRDGAALPFFHLEVQGLNPNSRYTVTVNTIQPLENACAEVVSQTYSVNANQNGALFFPLPPAENGLMQILVQP